MVRYPVAHVTAPLAVRLPLTAPSRIPSIYVDYDWSDAKELWAKNHPMNNEELLQEQVVMTTSASQIGQTVWVYRGSMWAYPWYTSVRLLLEDEAYAPWFVNFKPEVR